MDSTKNKIIKNAMELFAKHGYSGTSIRDIASSANVNIAAINYHFGSKENLLKNVFMESYKLIENSVVKSISGKQYSLAEMLAQIYKIYEKYHTMVIAYFRISVGTEVSIDSVFYSEYESPTAPGFSFIQKWLSEKYPKKSDEEIRWACKMLISVAIHQILMSHSQMTNCVKLKNELSYKVLEKNISKLAQTIEDGWK